MSKKDVVSLDKFFLLVGFLIFSVFVFSFASAADSVNLTTEEKAANCLNTSKDLMNKMLAENLTVARVNDSISQAEVLYNAQQVLKVRKQKTDFSLVVSYCDSVSTVYTLALDAKDSLSTLLRYYNQTVTHEMNTSSIDIIIDEVVFEMQSERYEKVQPLIDSAYQEITSVRARSTTLNLFVDSTTRGLKVFLLKNWKAISISLLILIILWFTFRKPLMIKLLNTRLDRLAKRRDSVKKLIMKSQQDYFQTGKIADSDYKIRVANYAELVRDIDRQVPLIKEELARLTGGKQ